MPTYLSRTHLFPLHKRCKRKSLSKLYDFSKIVTLFYASVPRSEPYDPYVPTAGNPPGATNAKTTKVRQEVDQVINIMQDNIDRVVDRGANIGQLQSKTGKRLDHEVLYKLREYC